MVRFINKNLKAHIYSRKENLSNIMDQNTLYKFTELLKFHIKDFGKTYYPDFEHLLQKLTIQLNITCPTDFDNRTKFKTMTLKESFLMLEIILDSYYNNKWKDRQYFLDFVEDLNDFFIVEKIPIQVRYLSDKREFFVEKIISPEISKKIGETLQNFSEEEKVFEDFKEAIKRFSVGDYEEAIRKCCISIEDYFCIILGKKTCLSVDSYYKDVSKKLAIPPNLDNRFSNIIKYIHSHRSIPSHGAKEKKKLKI